MAGVAVGSGLLLAFTLKEDKFDAKLPLIKRPPDTSKQEYFPQLELKYNETLILNDANELVVNTSGFLCPYFGDLSLASTPSNITSNSSTYLVVTQLSQPITCFSSSQFRWLGQLPGNDSDSCPGMTRTANRR